MVQTKTINKGADDNFVTDAEKTVIENTSGVNTGDNTVSTSGVATHLAGGSGGTIPYQSAAATTEMLSNGTNGQVLTSGGTTVAPSWKTPSAGGSGSNSFSWFIN